jgi:Skp family chaperone for outer membrane proteins
LTNRYEDPTQRLHSHNWSEEYQENYEKIFGKKETWLERRERERKEKEKKENDPSPS